MNAMNETLTLASEHGRRFDGYLARPQAGGAAAVLVLQDMFGLNQPIRAVGDRYAAAGHLALVPTLFWRSDIPGVIAYDDDQHATAWARLKALDLAVVAADMKTAV